MRISETARVRGRMRKGRLTVAGVGQKLTNPTPPYRVAVRPDHARLLLTGLPVLMDEGHQMADVVGVDGRVDLPALLVAEFKPVDGGGVVLGDVGHEVLSVLDAPVEGRGARGARGSVEPEDQLDPGGLRELHDLLPA